jgi:hypothetical protein
MAMPIAKEDDVRRIIGGDREVKIWRAVHRAWEDVRADIPRYSIWPRSRANMMFERLAVRFQEEFADEHPRVRFCFKDETVKIVVDEVILARCKKANDRGLGQNIETQTNMMFCEAQDDLFGFEGLQKVEIVYFLNQMATSIQGIVVQARDGDMRLWAYPIDRREAGGAGIVVPTPLPLPPAPPPSSDASDLVQPRKKPDGKDETDKSEK